MLSSAVSIVLGLAQVPQGLPAREAEVWLRIKPSVAVLIEAGREVGSAVCIDRRGYFIAHSSILSSPVLSARLDSGIVVSVSVRSVDQVTQLVLLTTQSPLAQSVRPIGLAELERSDRSEVASRPGDKRAAANLPLIAVLPTGPVSAELGPKERLGVLASSRRLLPLNEVQFESTLQSVSGALVFDMEGRLAGILSATLPGEGRAPQTAKPASADALPPAAAGFSGNRLNQQSGPGGLTVGYSLAPSVLSRVVRGFLSPAGIVKHPSIGVYCKDAVDGGAEIQSVTKDSPAEKAGVLKGDVIVEMAGSPVRNQIDFARIIALQDVGGKLTIVVRRGAESLTLTVLVGYGSPDRDSL